MLWCLIFIIISQTHVEVQPAHASNIYFDHKIYFVYSRRKTFATLRNHHAALQYIILIYFYHVSEHPKHITQSLPAQSVVHSSLTLTNQFCKSSACSVPTLRSFRRPHSTDVPSYGGILKFLFLQLVASGGFLSSLRYTAPICSWR